jgi:hypothetical protein
VVLLMNAMAHETALLTFVHRRKTTRWQKKLRLDASNSVLDITTYMDVMITAFIVIHVCHLVVGSRNARTPSNRLFLRVSHKQRENMTKQKRRDVNKERREARTSTGKECSSH